MRTAQLQQIAIGVGVSVLVLTLGLGIAIFAQKNRRAALYEHWLANQVNAPPPPVVEAPDPFDGLEDTAIAQVRAHVIAGTTLGARVEAGELTNRVDALSREGVSSGDWVSRRLEDYSVYEVSFEHTFHSVKFGPRWYVQMSAEGPRPDSSNGVVPVNGLSRQLHRTDLDEGLRYLNREAEVLQALTEHRFDGGLRLAAALLMFFEGRTDAEERSILGWHVVPEATDPEAPLEYRAYFQWEEDGQVADAWWEVNLTNRDFRAKDLQANEIMSLGGEVALADVLDLLPRTLDLTQPPEAEDDPRRRALRYLLANDRLVEAVGALLTLRGQEEDLEYGGWELNVTSERHVYDVGCRFTVGSEENRVTWRVDANTGVATPTNEIARTAQLTLEIAPPTTE
ncbi:MAG: hypothetical protein ACJAYU_004462 [Bradymonadia bacterium]|jgi:hypothetical protein